MKRIAIVAFLAWTVGCGSPQEEGPQRPAQGAIQVGASEPSRVDEGPPTPVDQGPPTLGEPRIVLTDDPCATDADCVPDGCCHPERCVAQGHQLPCGDSVCTTDCRFGTLDCGGACLCQAGRCAARLSTPPTFSDLGRQ